ncbi:hypothetical protein BE17_04680 [Sorangium cellulosum]|uniref:Protein kinase domain-containing protein n=1 Tax=Sorangium cellulosum TaxID=56 RepID=A0A150RN60_SORCE|nr:hypothetical protein BE17_04680 [Sorangium cellulosum]
MGEVWAATRESDMQQVAIKVLLARAAMKPDLVRRFDREAKIASAIKSPYVCQLLEVNEAADGAHLLVFEQLDGESLADRLKREQYLPFSEVGPIIDDVLQGLVAAHAAGVIHRDLKPGNIYLEHLGLPDRRERAKILDFGISKLTRREKEEPTPPSTRRSARSRTWRRSRCGAPRGPTSGPTSTRWAPWPSGPCPGGCRSRARRPRCSSR